MSEYPHSHRFNEEIQPRELRYGPGENQRVWEWEYRGINIGVNLGDIAAAPTEAIMCPTTPWLELGGGAIENRIASIAGDELFGTYNHEVIRLLEAIRNPDVESALTAAAQFASYMEKNTGMRINKAPHVIREDVLQATQMDELDTMGAHIALFHGGSIPAPAGKLSANGIKVVIFTNVTPRGRSMNQRDMVQFTQSAAQAADLTGVDSLTVPAVGTGFAAALGYGLSQADSILGFFIGATQFAETKSVKHLNRIDFNMFVRVNPNVGKQVTDLLEKIGVIDLIASKAQ